MQILADLLLRRRILGSEACFLLLLVASSYEHSLQIELVIVFFHAHRHEALVKVARELIVFLNYLK